MTWRIASKRLTDEIDAIILSGQKRSASGSSPAQSGPGDEVLHVGLVRRTCGDDHQARPQSETGYPRGYLRSSLPSLARRNDVRRCVVAMVERLGFVAWARENRPAYQME